MKKNTILIFFMIIFCLGIVKCSYGQGQGIRAQDLNMRTEMENDYKLITIDPDASPSSQIVKNITYSNLFKAYFPDPDETDQGVAGDGQTINTFVDALGSNSGTIILRHTSGDPNTTYTLTTSETIPSNIKLIIEKGAILDGAGTLTVFSPENIVASPRQKIFADPNIIAFTEGGIVYCEWVGVDPSDATDDTDLMSRFIAAIPDGSTLRLNEGTYTITDLTISDKDNFIIDSTSFRGSIIKITDDPNNGITFDTCTHIAIRDIKIESTDTSDPDAVGLYFTDTTAYVDVSGCMIRYCGKAIHCDDGYVHNYFNNNFGNCKNFIYLDNTSHSIVHMYVGPNNTFGVGNKNTDPLIYIRANGTRIFDNNFETVSSTQLELSAHIAAGSQYCKFYGNQLTESGGIKNDAVSEIINNSFINADAYTDANTNYAIIYNTAANTKIAFNEIIEATIGDCYGILCTGSETKIIGNNIKKLNQGIRFNSNYKDISHNNLNNCTNGIVAVSANVGCEMMGNTFNNCTTSYNINGEETLRINGYIERDAENATTVGSTGEIDLKSTVISQNYNDIYNGLRVVASGKKTGTSDDKILKFYFGSTSLTFNASNNDEEDWAFYANILFKDPNVQDITWHGGRTGSYSNAQAETWYEDLSAGDITMKITAECLDDPNANDFVVQHMWIVESY